jgi:hypothetical protein
MGQGAHFGPPAASALAAVYVANDDAPHAGHDHEEAPPRRGLFGRKMR